MKENTTFKTWLIVTKFAHNTKGLQLEKLTRPDRIGKKITPLTLNNMTMGQMVQLSNCKDGAESFYKTCEVLMGMTQKQVDESKATEVVRFVGWVVASIKRINNLFDKIKIKPENEEIRAGITTINFGIFGMIDWYALRMGITDHEEVMNVPWGRIYKCMEIDNKTMEFRKKLNKIYIDDNRRKN